MAVQILFHKQPLSSQQKAKLAKEGVVAIRTDDASQFKLLDATMPAFEMNDLVWALLDAVARGEQWQDKVNRRLVDNLAKLADESRQRRKVK